MDSSVSSSSAVSEVSQHLTLWHLPAHWPAQGDLIQWCHNLSGGAAAILVIMGLIYLLFGWYAFKGLMTLNAAMVGGCLGGMIADRLADAAPIGAIVGAVLLAATTWPTMKYAVALMGGAFGALVGAALWRSFPIDPQFAWAGALVGLVGFGMASFVVFRASVMMYMSLQGAVMLTFGVLSLLLKYQSIGPQLSAHFVTKSYLMPLSVFIPTMLGLLYQHHQSMTDAAASSKKK